MSIENRNIRMLEAERARIDKLITELRERQEHLRKMGPEIEMAEILHNSLCRFNHTDGCGWGYEKIEDFFKPGTTKNIWAEKAKKILETCSAEEVERVLTAINEARAY